MTKRIPVCGCCDRKVRQTKWLKIVSDERRMLCNDCLHEWYDGGHDGDSEKIKAGVLSTHGQFGGEANLTELLLETYVPPPYVNTTFSPNSIVNRLEFLRGKIAARTYAMPEGAMMEMIDILIEDFKKTRIGV